MTASYDDRAASTTRTGTARSTVVGVFHDRRRAEEAVAELERVGFGADQIGFAMRDGDGASTVAGAGEVTTDTGPGSGALTGAATGGVLGGLAGAAAALLIPGVGPVVAAGILGPILGSAAAGAAIGAAGGGLLGGLVTTGVPEEDAAYYDREFQSGRAIVTVKAGDRAEEARDVLYRFGAYDVDNQSGSTSAQSSGTYTAPQAGATTTNRTERTQFADRDRTSAAAGTTDLSREVDEKGVVRVPEVEERLEVEKRQVEAGEVRVRKEVHEERQSVPVELMREEVHVERRDVERPIRPGEDAFQEGTIRVPVRAEQAVAHKEAVVTGEVVINKERTTETEEVADTVRHTHVEVDNKAQKTANAWTEHMPRYQSYWQQRYGTTGRWEEYEPAYRFGYEMRHNPRYQGRRWEEVESDFQRDWSSRHSNSPWERFKAHVRHAWDDIRD